MNRRRAMPFEITEREALQCPFIVQVSNTGKPFLGQREDLLPALAGSKADKPIHLRPLEQQQTGNTFHGDPIFMQGRTQFIAGHVLAPMQCSWL